MLANIEREIMWGYNFLQARSVNLAAGQHGAALEIRYRLHRTDG